MNKVGVKLVPVKTYMYVAYSREKKLQISVQGLSGPRRKPKYAEILTSTCFYGARSSDAQFLTT